MATPPPSILPKIISLGAAALGGLILKDRLGHTQHELERIDKSNIENDFLGYSQSSMYDYTGNPTMTRVKRGILNPANYHFITRPWSYIKGYANMIAQNLIPIGLITVGLTYGFNSSLGAVFKGIGRGLSAVSGPVGHGIRTLFGAIRQVAGPALRTAWNNFHMPSMGPKGVLAVGAAALMALYGMSQLKREFTGENRDSFFKATYPPDGRFR